MGRIIFGRIFNRHSSRTNCPPKSSDDLTLGFQEPSYINSIQITGEKVKKISPDEWFPNNDRLSVGHKRGWGGSHSSHGMNSEAPFDEGVEVKTLAQHCLALSYEC